MRMRMTFTANRAPREARPRAGSAALMALALGAASLGACSSSAPSGEGVDLFGTRIRSTSPSRASRWRRSTSSPRATALFDLSLRPSDGLGPLYTRTPAAAVTPRACAAPGSCRRWSSSRPTASRPPPISRRSPTATPCTRSPRAARRRRSCRRRRSAASRSRRASGPPSSAAATSRPSSTARSSASRPSRRRAPTASTAASTAWSTRREPNPDTTFHAHQAGRRRSSAASASRRASPRVDDFTADALQGDMGITSPLRPDGAAEPRRARRRLSSPGVDVDIDERQRVARSTCACIAIPTRAEPGRARRRSSSTRRSARVCHVPSLQDARRLSRSRRSPASTRPSTPISCCTTWATRSPTA